MADQAGQGGGCFEQGIEVHAGVQAHALEHVHQILGADIAAGARCVGAAAEAAEGGVEAVDAGVQRCQGIGQAHAAGVVKMRGEYRLGPALQRLAADALDLCRVGHAGGVAQGHALYADLQQTLGQFIYARLGHIALEGAAEGGRQRGVDEYAAAARHFDDLGELRERLLRRHAQVGQAVGVAGGHHQVDLVHLAGQRALAALHVGHQHGVFHAWHAGDAAHHFFGIAQVGNGLGRGEGGDLDLGQAGVGQAVDQGDLVFGGYEGRLDLEAVAGGDVLDIKAFAHG